MTARKFGYRRGNGSTRASKSRDEYLFCIDASHDQFENEFLPCVWGIGLCDSREDVASIWFHHKDEALPAYIKAHPGQRPSCWWVFEARIDVNAIPTTPEQQAVYLARHGCLTAAERKHLPNEWFKAAPPKLTLLEK